MLNSLRLLKPVNTMVAAVALVSASLLPITVQANESTEVINVEKKHSAKKHHKGFDFKKMMKRLKLSEEQKSQVSAIQKEAKAEFDLYKNDMKAYKESKKLLLEGDSLDESALEALHMQYQATFTAIEVAKTKRMHAIKQVLTEEQFTKLKKMIKKRMKGKKGKKDKKNENKIAE